MTREEAINMIKDDMRLHHNYLSGEYRKALRMAISALEQPEIVRCEDCKCWDTSGYCIDFMTQDEDGFCKWAVRREE